MIWAAAALAAAVVVSAVVAVVAAALTLVPCPPARAACVWAPGSIPPHSAHTPGEALPDAEAAAAGETSVDPQAEGTVDVRRVGPPQSSSSSSGSGDKGTAPLLPGAACVRLVDLAALAACEEASPALTRLHHAGITQHLFDLPLGASPTCLAALTFHDAPAAAFLLLGIACAPTGRGGGGQGGPPTGAILCFRHVEAEVAYDGLGQEVAPGAPPGEARARARLQRLQFLHATPLPGPPGALCGLAGRALVGVGGALWLMDLGRRRLLRR